MGAAVGFWIFAVIATAGAVSVIATRNIFRAGLSLALFFVAVAALFFTLNADFLGVVQLLIYVGAIAVLILFTIFVTPNFRFANTSNQLWLPTLGAAGLFLAALLVGVFRTSWHVTTLADGPTTDAMATGLFDQHTGLILPFEAASVLLLAAIIGAIVVARGRED